MKAKAALVWTQGRVKLDSVAPIDLHFTFIIFPGHAELDETFWNGGDGEGSTIFGFLLEEGGVFERGGQFVQGLLEFRFGWKVGHFSVVVFTHRRGNGEEGGRGL